MKKSHPRSTSLLIGIPVSLMLILLMVTAPVVLGQRIWVCGETEKVNPITGSLISSGSYKDGLNSYEIAQRTKNFLWDDSSRTLTLAGASGELLGFQVIIEREGLELTGISVRATDFSGPAGEIIRQNRFEFFLAYYILKDGTRYPDPLIPLKLVPE